MSNQITTAFVQQYKSNLLVLSQQKGSKVRNAVRADTDIVGKSTFVDRLGATAAVQRTTRHGDTPLVDTPHSRRKVSLVPYEWADLIDNADKVRLLIDPQSDYAMNAGNAFGRSMDDVILAAAGGTAYTGEDGSGTQALPSGQKVAAGAANLTLAKLLSAREILNAGDVEMEDRFIYVSPAMMTSLLNTTEIKSSDYNTVKALVQGQIDTYLGFKFIEATRAPANSTADGHFAYVWQRRGLYLAIGEDIKTRISERADKSYSVQVYGCMDIGATRVEDEAVVEIDCIGG